MKLLATFCCSLTVTSACAGQELIQGDRVGAIRIGSPTSSIPKGLIVSSREEPDSETGDDLVQTLGVAMGNQILEVEISNGRIQRIAVSGPGLKTRDGAEVGKPIAAISTNSKLKVAIGPGGNLIVLPQGSCGPSLVTNLELSDADIGRDWDVMALRSMPSNVVLKRILVTGACRRR